MKIIKLDAINSTNEFLKEFIQVNSSEGSVYVNADKIEMVIPKIFNNIHKGCSLRMNANLFINVYEPIEDIIARLQKVE